MTVEYMGRVVKRLYIAGPMSGVPEFNYPAFHHASHLLDEAGFLVESPAAEGQVEGWTWEDYVRRGLVQLLGCDGVATLPGWGDSRGARLEVHVATSLKMAARPVEAWLEAATAPGGDIRERGA